VVIVEAILQEANAFIARRGLGGQTERELEADRAADDRPP
jgi:hypothetical protein